MYRPPEMVSLWTNFEVGLGADIWALGCILYTMCFTMHPFREAATLQILNGKVTIPTNPIYTDFHIIISTYLFIYFLISII